ncbi:hypothetical protein [Sphingobacterium thalpophilum]|uniref:hypothetical protein n=1 Tax=Sphingobacterium thalpophilum TaxID=259 RepID=UPI003D96BEA8
MITVKLNGADLYATYGILFRKGAYAELLKAPKRKKGYEYDWGDENGIETDPQEVPVYERLTYNLPIVIEARNGAEFFQRYNAFKMLLLNSKEFNLDVLDLGRRFKVRYSDMSSFDKLTTIKGNKKVTCYFTLQLTDDYPTENFQIV